MKPLLVLRSIPQRLIPQIWPLKKYLIASLEDILRSQFLQTIQFFQILFSELAPDNHLSIVKENKCSGILPHCRFVKKMIPLNWYRPNAILLWRRGAPIAMRISCATFERSVRRPSFRLCYY